MTKPPLLGQHAPILIERAERMRKAMTPAEARLWAALRGSKLGGWHFRRQHVIGRVIVDFYCYSAGLVVEVDGPYHLAQVEQDAQRDAYLAERGLRTLRLTNAEVEQDLPAALQKIAAHLPQEGKTTAGSPLPSGRVYRRDRW